MKNYPFKIGLAALLAGGVVGFNSCSTDCYNGKLSEVESVESVELSENAEDKVFENAQNNGVAAVEEAVNYEEAGEIKLVNYLPETFNFHEGIDGIKEKLAYKLENVVTGRLPERQKNPLVFGGLDNAINSFLNNNKIDMEDFSVSTYNLISPSGRYEDLVIDSQSNRQIVRSFQVIRVDVDNDLDAGEFLKQLEINYKGKFEDGIKGSASLYEDGTECSIKVVDYGAINADTGMEWFAYFGTGGFVKNPEGRFRGAFIGPVEANDDRLPLSFYVDFEANVKGLKKVLR